MENKININFSIQIDLKSDFSFNEILVRITNEEFTYFDLVNKVVYDLKEFLIKSFIEDNKGY